MRQPDEADRLFRERDLHRYNGEDGPMYIAFEGIVYEVTHCPKWRTGLHEGLHFPGQDLTDQLGDAPHGAEVFRRPCVQRIGRLQEES